MDTKIMRRVLVNFDDTAWPPDDDGAPPIIRIEPGRGYGNYRTLIESGAEHLPDVSRIQQIIDETPAVNNEQRIEFLTRWLNIFVGPTRNITEGSDVGEYLEVASHAWQKFVGVVDFNQQEWRDTTCEFQDYLRGEVYWLQPQRLVRWVELDSQGVPREGVDKQEWEEDDNEDPIGGYYGEGRAIESAATGFFAGLDYDVVHGEYKETLKEVRR